MWIVWASSIDLEEHIPETISKIPDTGNGFSGVKTRALIEECAHSVMRAPSRIPDYYASPEGAPRPSGATCNLQETRHPEPRGRIGKPGSRIRALIRMRES